MSGGFGYRNWNATLPPAGEEWREGDAFDQGDMMQVDGFDFSGE